MRALLYAAALFGINLYICRDLLFAPTSAMNSMHGFWAAIAKWADGSWFHATWWPFWDCGIPFEFTYAPLVPALAAMIAALRGVPEILGIQTVSALVYCLCPVTLFVMLWRLTGSSGCSFLAGLFYSLTAPTELVLPDANFSLRHFWDARRFYLLSVWDDTPLSLALTILPLAILFLVLSLRQRRRIYYAAAILCIALAALSSTFGVVMVAMASLCLLFVWRQTCGRSGIALVLAIGAFSYAIVCPFLPPSLIFAIRGAAIRGPGGEWTAGSWTALALVALGWVVLWHYLPRWTKDWKLQFFGLFAYVAGSIPLLETYLHRSFLPQPNRYKLLMEFTLAPVIVFGARALIRKAPVSWRVALFFLVLALAGEQVIGTRQYAKAVLRPVDLSQSIEYRASHWAEQNLAGVRVMLPGSIGLWANTFSAVHQFGGSSWSMAYNLMQQLGVDAVYEAAETPQQEAQFSLAWLKAYGVGAVCVSGKQSPEFWKRYKYPEKFEGLLPVLWRESDTTIYSVPQRTPSLAHVLPRSAIVTRRSAGGGDVADLVRLDAALDDPALPPADFRWEGRNRMRIHADAAAPNVVFLQVSYHPGWHATAAGRSVKLRPDALGLTWFEPGCSGPCEIELNYDGGWELRVCRIVSLLAMVSLLAGLVVKRRRFSD